MTVAFRRATGLRSGARSRDGGQLNSGFFRVNGNPGGTKHSRPWPSAEEIVQHIRHCGAGGSNTIEGHTGDIFVAAKSRKMAKYFAGVCIAEHEPWITFVGYPGFDLDMPPLILKGFSSLLENT